MAGQKDTKHVTFDSGDGEHFALVMSTHDNGNLRLLVFGIDGASWDIKDNVPRRDEGGGHTWR